ncbi:glutaredoxin family protein [Jeotgalibacillus sp. R-1-5s-1]|uniref:glutaredoxin family protein n=1 Tax=Jeotgalibacillus sp. R-1-5s-1 TaxID=2555897 RepID=UPI00106DC521|nr:glutaredoxin family protein [Jeotgalibacillus sp. R-1-5s-1]TFD94506.1 glutaredoxin family protein [Jeotgalibacillus sp. R-1-5s-1]
MKLTLYTRPTCSDCQQAKKYLKEESIPYTEIDLSNQPDKEGELRAVTGTGIVPAFVFSKQLFFGIKVKRDVYIGFERNEAAVRKLSQAIKSG